MKRPAACLAALAVVLPACGEDDRLSTADFKRRAAEICQSSERDVQRLGTPEGTEPRQVADFFRDALGVARRRLSDQQALRPPEALEDEQARIVQIQRSGIELVEDVIGRLERGTEPSEALQDAQPRLQKLQDESDALARRLGVQECVTGS